MKNSSYKKMIVSAMFLAIGMFLPFITSQIKEIGDSLLPMHLVVMLCGIFCGAKYGMTVGLLLPILRAIIFSMPPLFPNSIWMALELSAYGFVMGMLYSKIGRKHIGYLYLSLIISMIAGRIIWAVSKLILLGIGGKVFTFNAFIAGGFIDAFPGIILQLILIPTIVKMVVKYNRGV